MEDGPSWMAFGNPDGAFGQIFFSKISTEKNVRLNNPGYFYDQNVKINVIRPKKPFLKFPGAEFLARKL